MGKANLVDIGTIQFRTQGEATDVFSQMLRRYSPGERVKVTDAIHLEALLKRHTEYLENVGCGISYFFVDIPGDPEDKAPLRNPGQCFWIYRTDSTKDDFSIGNCVTQIKRG